jgi:hypothetical protein
VTFLLSRDAAAHFLSHLIPLKALSPLVLVSSCLLYAPSELQTLILVAILNQNCLVLLGKNLDRSSQGIVG